VRLTWSPRIQPLPVQGCWAEGTDTIERLRKKLQPGRGLRLAQGESCWVVLGEQVPWVEGLTYLGRQDLLYLPTLWQPDLPLDWLTARLQKLGPPPWALIPTSRGFHAAGATPRSDPSTRARQGSDDSGARALGLAAAAPVL